MLKKSQRLNLSLDFKRIATSGKRIYSPLFSGFYIKEGRDIPKIGIALAKKDFRRAHQRNRARRLVSAVVQSEYSRLSKGLQLVIMPKERVLQSSLEELKNEFTSIRHLY